MLYERFDAFGIFYERKGLYLPYNDVLCAFGLYMTRCHCNIGIIAQINPDMFPGGNMLTDYNYRLDTLS